MLSVSDIFRNYFFYWKESDDLSRQSRTILLQSATVITEWDSCSSKHANNSRLMDTSCFIKLAVILVTINNMHFFYTACFFITISWRLYYFSIVWSLTFYWHTALRYTVLKSFYFPTLSAKDINLLDTQNWL